MMPSTRGDGRRPNMVRTGGLKYRGISCRTRKRYEQQLRRFFEHLTRHEIPIPSSFRQLDETLANYIDHMFLEGEPVGYAGDAISAISRFYPNARVRIPVTRLWFRNWQREVVRVRALPIPSAVCQGMAGIALAMGRSDLAALLPLAFLCMLRTSEIVGVSAGDITFSPFGTSAIIRLPTTKTSGPNTEEVVLEDSMVVGALKVACQGVGRSEPLYSKKPTWLGEDLRWLGRLVGFQHKRFTPYSLRRGGATWHFHKYGSLSKTSVDGRWKHERTAKIYIDGAAAEWASWQFSDNGSRMLRRGARAYRQRFSCARS